MSKEEQPPELLGAIEHALVKHQAFGDSAYILDQLEVSFRRRLNLISARLPVAGDLLEAFERADGYTRYRIVGNTVIRCALQHAHTQLETDTEHGLPVADCAKVFEETILHLQLGKSGTPFENGTTQLERLGTEPYHGWVWKQEYPDDVFGRSFRNILDLEYGDSLCTPSSDEIAMLMKGEQLLRELLPSLSRSALGHAHLVGCFPDAGFWKGKVSSSQIRMGGTIFLNRQILINPWCVAEHLLHESLHQKLYDFRHGHSLLEPDFSVVNSPRVCSLWNAQDLNKANHWDAHRAFAAFHVYVQLSLLATVAEQRGGELEKTYGPYRGIVESRKALERARYLGEKLQELCWDELGLAGRRLRDWLMSVLDFLDPYPPPRGAYIHLLLDLYQREANMVDSVLRQSEPARSSLGRQLMPVAKEEVESTRRVLSAISAERELDRFNKALDQYGDEELGTQFPAVRRIIARTLLDASPDGYGLTSRALRSGDPDELVKQMVERGSERLYLIQAGLPAAVAGAKRRARDQRFTKSCEDSVGRLLATLAAAVPSEGRILEIGTGVGVGLAWITVGLGERSDVEVVSIEADRRLANAAGNWTWPPYVQLVTADALEVLAKHGTFNLVFVDAAPIKYGHIESVFALLRPGGIVVVDDLHAGPRTSELQHAEKASLRHSLLSHPELQGVELDWSSGVIVATNSARVGQKRTELDDEMPSLAKRTTDCWTPAQLKRAASS
jgi:predicted O-methyltransferase YrrM